MFCELSALLYDFFVQDFRTYRREVKTLLANLLAGVPLACEEVIIFVERI